MAVLTTASKLGVITPIVTSASEDLLQTSHGRCLRAQQDRIRKLCRALYAASVRLRHPDTLSIESLCDEVEPSHEVPLTQEVPLTSLCVPVVERVDVSRVER